MKQVIITNVRQVSVSNGRIKYTYGELRDFKTKELIKGAKLTQIIEEVYETNPTNYEVMKAF